VCGDDGRVQSSWVHGNAAKEWCSSPVVQLVLQLRLTAGWGGVGREAAATISTPHCSTAGTGGGFIIAGTDSSGKAGAAGEADSVI
jgi:hypothetical protein